MAARRPLGCVVGEGLVAVRIISQLGVYGTIFSDAGSPQ
jgi:hypothetical protein